MNRELERQAIEHYALAKARLVRDGIAQTKPITRFADYATWYEQNVSSHQRGFIKARSILKALRKAFGETLLSDIDQHRIQEWMTTRLKDALQPASVNRELDQLKTVLASAVPKYLVASPATGIRRLRVPESERRILTAQEEAKLLAVANDAETALIVTAIDTLLRLSNLVFLEWPQVKFAQQIIVPLNAKVSHDLVPMSSRCQRALKRLGPKRSGFVFASLHRGVGSTAAKNNAIRLLHDLCQKAHVPHGRAADGITFHCLRHTGATRALQAGASVRTVMKLGGWRDERTAMRYTHASDADVKAAAESIGRSVIPFSGRRLRSVHGSK